MYAWRQMSEEMRAKTLEYRKSQNRPWHSPPHRNSDRTNAYLFTAACFEHQPVIGFSVERMAVFEEALLSTIRECQTEIFAWVVLPNHYHLLARTPDAVAVLKTLGLLHGRVSFQWNGEEKSRGRKVWCNAVETAMKSERHFWATLNYIHHNPVKHGWMNQWQEWPFSSAGIFLKQTGREEATRLWKEYPIQEYGRGWDD